MTASAVHPELFQDAAYSSPSKECDVIMKGGITSGVVYPLAICEVARDYRLRSVGGSSAGAIAAAAAAAAEVGRQKGRGTGFVGLARLPEKLGEQEQGRSRLFSLFQPNPETRGVFGILSAVIFEPPAEEPGGDFLGVCARHWRNPLRLASELWRRGVDASHKSPTRKTLPVLCALFRAFPGWCLTSIAPIFFLAAFLEGMALNHAFPTGLAGLLLGSLFIVPTWLLLFGAILAFPIRRAILSAVEDNGFGLTTGYLPEDEAPRQPLTSFLCEQIDELAGTPAGEPLTFGDLAECDVRFEVLTTNISLGRPYTIPFAGKQFHWDPAELARYFPPYVIEHMLAHSTEVQPAEGEAEVRVDGTPRRLRTLPTTEDLPVVFAARLSLSFPMLICAVPLYKRHWLEGEERWVRCWFSDGGISSNLPVHFFDAALPGRPTFAINLRGTSELKKDPCDNVRLPTANSAGIQYRARPIEGVVGFLLNVVDTMQNWADDMQLRAPGSRDRVATIYHNASEGGLNLDMPPEKIDGLTTRGACAGQAFANDFEWGNHRWIRFRSIMRLASTMAHQIGANAGDEVRELIPDPPSYPIRTKAQQTLANRALKKIEELGALEEHADNPFSKKHDADQAPKPLLSLRSVPRP